jgi:hypothetical protein
MGHYLGLDFFMHVKCVGEFQAFSRNVCIGRAVPQHSRPAWFMTVQSTIHGPVKDIEYST